VKDFSILVDKVLKIDGDEEDEKLSKFDMLIEEESDNLELLLNMVVEEDNDFDMEVEDE
jgi:hypothetical protein